DLGAGRAGVDHGERRGGVVAEDDIDVPEIDCGGQRTPPVLTRLMRSRMIASTTIASPASRPSGMLTELSARTTGLPRPLAPISAAITTIDRQSMMHWVSPAMMVGMAAGSSTFHRS